MSTLSYESCVGSWSLRLPKKLQQSWTKWLTWLITSYCNWKAEPKKSLWPTLTAKSTTSSPMMRTILIEELSSSPELTRKNHPKSLKLVSQPRRQMKSSLKKKSTQKRKEKDWRKRPKRCSSGSSGSEWSITSRLLSGPFVYLFPII